MTHTRGKPYHPMTQGKIERYHGERCAAEPEPARSGVIDALPAPRRSSDRCSGSSSSA